LAREKMSNYPLYTFLRNYIKPIDSGLATILIKKICKCICPTIGLCKLSSAR